MMYIITGGSGYIGGQLIKNIIAKGGKAINIDKNKPVEKIEGENFIKCDLTDLGKTRETISSLDPKEEYVIIHLAGLFEKDMKKREEWKFGDFLSMNTFTTKNLVDELNRQNLNVKSFIFSSAALVNCLEKINDFYPRSKLEAEEHIRKNPPSDSAHILRISRVIGGLDNGRVSKDIISDFIKKMLSDDNIVLKGSDIQRDYIHMHDVCNIILSPMHNGLDIKNVYSSEQISTRRIIEMLHEALLKKGFIKREKNIDFREDKDNPLPKIEGKTDFTDLLKHKTSEDVVRKTIDEYMEAMDKKIPFN
ncbi:MAG: NAD-dependent epimerase/dehydratase family protein [Candidatus Aenigmarchaeota archaeon]|nr:NAD-dependent epimerase/dehydratase family protein [Candidatus Aenigmarchaeota archaeon]